MKSIVLTLALLFASVAAAQDRPGLAVDAKGGPVIDPTENVKALNEAANKRQDDLRAATERLLQAKLDAEEQLSRLRYMHAQELARAQADKLNDEAKLRAEYAERLAVAEAKRIDAIRAVDVNAVAVASQRTSEGVTALATQTSQSAEVLRNQVSQSAEALRTLVASTAATAAATQQQLISALSARITTLEQAGNEAKGKQTVQDPAYAALLVEVQALSRSRADVSGASAGRGEVGAWIVGGLGLLFALIAAMAAVLAVMRRPDSRARSA